MLQNFLILKPVSKTVSAPSLLGRKKKKKSTAEKILPCAWSKLKKKKIEKRENKRKREEKIYIEEEIQKLFLQYFWL